MNYHYIDYMIKERQKLERDESERKRMLRMASSQTGDGSKNQKVWGISFAQLHIIKP